MSKCNSKVKNACKICFETVNLKNGLQCQGACKKWAHFKCLNYTPGKIQDIKKGVIKVTCPCPDCATAFPKEVLTKPPYSCTNQKCPANSLPKCESLECPSNKPPPRLPSPSPPATPSPPPSPPRGPKPRPPKHKSKRPTCPPSPPCFKSSSSSESGCKGPCSPPDTSTSEEDSSSPDNAQLLSTLAHMCNTVGTLSNQLKELMCKLDK